MGCAIPIPVPPAKVVDDAGVRQSLGFISDAGFLHEMEDVSHASFEEVMAATASPHPEVKGSDTKVSGVIGYVMIIICAEALKTTGVVTWASYAIPFVAWAYGSWVVDAWISRCRSTRVYEALLGAAVCPSCFERLDRNRERGIVVCSRCSAGWNADRVGRDIGRMTTASGEVRDKGLPRMKDASGRWRRVYDESVSAAEWHVKGGEDSEVAVRRIECDGTLRESRLEHRVRGALPVVVLFVLFAATFMVGAGFDLAVLGVVGGLGMALVGLYAYVLVRTGHTDAWLGRHAGGMLLEHGFCACCCRDISDEYRDEAARCACGAVWER